ncbi:hypothetical protein CAC42_7149 [Sphaceloma murrayae]|uniref:Uncharacterized protein n=1 Tax=Sphaceloma murrayae TaxID=2082308 RepID=A0A2K1QQV0_9PEZI|nr:hypothetical protein CAC42_7149 [Sphaceloma murrayae]
MQLLSLPAEIRSNIFSFILSPAANRHVDDANYAHYNFAPALTLLLVSKQVATEARAVFSRLNTFIVISTPWNEAQAHVAIEGHVPVIAGGDKALGFDQWTMMISINAPNYRFADDEMRRFVIHIDDLPAFTTTWKYSDLTHPQLNPNLGLSLKFKDPKAKGEWDEPTIPKAIQARLLLPFGVVKRLAALEITGRPMPLKSLTEKLQQEMNEPHESPESCLRRATQLKDEGNKKLKIGKYEEALQLYNQAWLAMHIVVNGRVRHVHADLYYNRELREDPFKGMQGHTVRLALRVKLVANTVMLYLKMEKYEDAKYWGMRTINMIRQAIGLPEHEEVARAEDEAITNFVAATDMGKIYFRTAMACKALDDKAEARKLLKIAQVYLPMDRKVQEEVAACALRIG